MANDSSECDSHNKNGRKAAFARGIGMNKITTPRGSTERPHMPSDYYACASLILASMFLLSISPPSGPFYRDKQDLGLRSGKSLSQALSDLDWIFIRACKSSPWTFNPISSVRINKSILILPPVSPLSGVTIRSYLKNESWNSPRNDSSFKPRKSSTANFCELLIKSKDEKFRKDISSRLDIFPSL